MKKSQNARLALRTQTLKSLTAPTVVTGGAFPPICPPDGTCVPGGSATTSTGVRCCTRGGRSH